MLLHPSSCEFVIDLTCLQARNVFGGTFNIMLWCCVAAELLIAVQFDGPSMRSVDVFSSHRLKDRARLRVSIEFVSIFVTDAFPSQQRPCP